MFLKKTFNNFFNKSDNNKDFDRFLNSYKSYCGNRYLKKFEHDFQRSMEIQNNRDLKLSEKLGTEKKQTLKISYAKSDFFGTLKIFHSDENIYDSNTPPIWHMKYFNLLKESQKEQLLRIVYDFTMFEGAEKILKNSWETGVEKDSKIRNILGYKDKDREKDFETRLELIQKVLDHSGKKCNNIFKFLLIASILRTSLCLSEKNIESILNNPHDYGSLSIEDMNKLTIFNALLPILIINDSPGEMNRFFISNYSKNINVLYSLIGKIVYDERYHWSKSENIFKHRSNKIFRNELDYIFNAAESVANYIDANLFGYDMDRVSDSTEKVSNLLCLPNKTYSLIFSNIYKEPYYKEISRKTALRFKEKEYVDELHTLINNLHCDEFCKKDVSDDFKKSVDEYAINMFDFNLLNHLLNHDEDKLLEIAKFLENSSSSFAPGGPYLSVYEEEYYVVETNDKTSGYTAKFKYSFVYSILQWGMEDSVPFSMWINLNEDSMMNSVSL